MKDAKDRVTRELPMVDVPRPGRQRTSTLSPREQNAAAQSARRIRMTGAGFAWRGFWLDKAALAALADLKTILGCGSQDEALQRLLAASKTPAVRALLDAGPGADAQQDLFCDSREERDARDRHRDAGRENQQNQGQGADAVLVEGDHECGDGLDGGGGKLERHKGLQG